MMTNSKIPVQEAEELFALQRALQRTQGFALYVARVNSRVLRNNIEAWLSENVARPFQTVKLDSKQPIIKQIIQSAKLSSADSILSVYGLEELSATEETEWLQSQLNWRRSSFQKIERTLLLWLPEYLLTLLMQSAPDFFDWHSGLYEFRLPEKDIQREYKKAMSGSGPMLARTPIERIQRIATLKGLLDEYKGRKNEDHIAQARILNTLGGLYNEAGDIRKAILYYEQSLSIAKKTGDIYSEGVVLGNLGYVYDSLGESQRAIEFYEKSLVIDRQIGNKHGEGQNLGNLGIVYLQLNEPHQAIEFFEKHLTIARDVGDKYGESNALGNLGIAYKDLGELSRAIIFYEQQLVIVHEIGDRRGEAAALGNLGIAYGELGEFHKAITFLEQALAIHRETGSKLGEAAAYWNIGELLFEQGEFEHAAESMQMLVGFYTSIEHPEAQERAKRVEEVRKKAAEQTNMGKM